MFICNIKFAFISAVLWYDKIIANIYVSGGHRGIETQACDCKRDGFGFHSHSEKYLIFSFSRIETKPDVEIRY